MIQRKQTIYLVLAIVALMLCAYLPIGMLEPKTLGDMARWSNLGIVANPPFEGALPGPLPLVALLFNAILSVVAVFSYKQRPLQAKLCVGAIVLGMVWYALVGYSIFTLGLDGWTYHTGFGSALPAVAIILQWMARQGIQADERLVRSMDRIR